ncbi:MAG: response regulator [Anaerolineae bacterium]|nr:response regulator [Anaerolineae bacterium]
METTILYIEDNPLNMRLVRRMLASFGYNIAEAPDALSGMKKINERKPDLILVDVNLPGIDGLELTRRLKADPYTADIPIVALTANAMHGDRELCLEAGCDGYIAKPVSRLELKNAVNHYLQPVAQTA